MKKNLLVGMVTAMFLVGMTGVASATLISITGTGGEFGTGTDLSSGSSESNSIQGFNEQQNVYINDNSVYVNYIDPAGDYTGTDEDGQYLDAGYYSSHILHYDPVGSNGGNTGNITVQFTFDDDVVGIMTSTAYLDASDSIFGSYTYVASGDAGRRTEAQDSFSVSGNVVTATFFKTSSTWIDEMRVITLVSTVPEPTTMLLFGAGLAGLAGVARRKKK